MSDAARRFVAQQTAKTKEAKGMPPVSKKQAKAMFAAKAGNSTLGIPPNVGQEFVSGLMGHPGSVAKLPASAPKAKAAPKAALKAKAKKGTTHIHVHIHGKGYE